MKALQLADYRYIALSLILAILWQLVRGAAWRTLLQEKASYKDVFLTVNEGYLLNNVLPFRLGEIGRSYLLSRKSPLGFWEILPTIVIERGLDVAFAAGLLLCTLPFVVGATWARQAGIITGGIVVAGLVFMYILARNEARALSIFEKLSLRWPLLKRIGGNILPSFFTGLSVLTSPARFIRAILWFALNWGLSILQYYTLLLAFFPNGQFLWAVFTLGAAALGIAAPSSPGAIGVLELTIVGALALFHQNPSSAFAFAITAHIFNYLISGIIGAYALAQDGESLTGLYKSARSLLSRNKQEA